MKNRKIRKFIIFIIAFFALSQNANAAFISKGSLIFTAVKTVIKVSIKAYVNFDHFDTGKHQTGTQHEIIENESIGQYETSKSAIAVYQEKMNDSVDGSETYIKDSDLYATSDEASAVGYLHANSGSHSSTASAGITGTDFSIISYGENAFGVYTESGTSFIRESDGGIGFKNNNFYIHGYNNADAYAIYADGDWYCGIENTKISITTEAGQAVGIYINADTFTSEDILNSDITIETETGDSFGIYLDSKSGDMIWADEITGSIDITNTNGGENGYAVGLLLTGAGSTEVNSVHDLDIKINTKGDIGIGIGVDDINANAVVYEITDTSIDVYVERGVALGIHADTLEDFYVPIVDIENVDVSVAAHGNVYGYLLGEEIDVDNITDGGIAFYNSYYCNSEKIAEHQFDNTSCSITVESLGTSSDYTGNAAYGIYLKDQNFKEDEDLSFKSVTASAAGTPYGMYLESSYIVHDFNTKFKVYASSSNAYGIYLTDGSSMGNLGGSIEMGIEGDEDDSIVSGIELNAIFLEDNSSIGNITTDISISESADKFIAISKDNSSSVGVYDGNIDIAYVSPGTDVLSSDFYVFMLGKKIGVDDSILFYNRDTMDSTGFTLGDNVSIDLTNLNWGYDYFSYGIYLDGDYHYDLKIQMKEVRQAVSLYNGATLNLRDSFISTNGYVVDGENSSLTITDCELSVIGAVESPITLTNGASLNIKDSYIRTEINASGASEVVLEGITSLYINTSYFVDIDVSDKTSLTFNGDNQIDGRIFASGEGTSITINTGSLDAKTISIEDGASLSMTNVNATLANNYADDFLINLDNASDISISGIINMTASDDETCGILINSNQVIKFNGATTLSSYTKENQMVNALINNSSDLNISGLSNDVKQYINGNVTVTNGNFNILAGNFTFDSNSWDISGTLGLGSKDESTGEVTTSIVTFSSNTTINASEVIFYASSTSEYSGVILEDGVSLTLDDDLAISYILADDFSADVGDTLILSQSVLSDSFSSEDIKLYLADELLSEEIWELFNDEINGFGVSFLQEVTAVPEPSTYAILLGLLALAFVRVRGKK